MAISNLTPVEEWPTRKLPQDRFDDAVKTAMDQMSVMIGELNGNFIPQTNEAIEVINEISPNIETILDAPNQAAAAAASAQSAESSKNAAAQSASAASASEEVAASSASSATASKTAAAQSATEAAASASSAESSKNAAAQSASDAAGEADSAAQSASEAAASASAASSSKTAAAQSATEAAASAQAAASSKTAAAQSAATAKDEADRAKDEADRVASIVAVDVASDTKAGIVKTDAKTLFVTDQYGTLTAEDVAIGGDLTDTARGRGQIGDCYSIPSSGVDFNTLTKAGRYWFSIQALTNSTNKPPTTVGGFCDVLGEEGSQKYTKQIYHVYNAPTFFIREHRGANSGWSESWTKIITENNIATTSKVGLTKVDNVTTKISTDGTLSVPTFAGSSVGLVPAATSADAGKALLGNGTWGEISGGAAAMTLTEDLYLTESSPRALVLSPSVSGLSVHLPNHANLAKGTTFHIWVKPTFNMQLLDFSGEVVKAYPTLSMSSAYLLQLIDAEAGLWALAEYKSGSTSDAAYVPGLNVGKLFIFKSSNYLHLRTTALSENKVLVCYRYTSAVYAIILTISGTTVSVGAETVVYSGKTAHMSAVTLSEDKALVCFYVDSSPYSVVAIVLTISGTTVSVGTEKTIHSGNVRDVSTVALSEGKALVCFSDQENSGYGTAVILTISGTAVSVGTETVFTSSMAKTLSAVTLSETRVLACYQLDTAVVGVILTVAGATVSAGTETICAPSVGNPSYIQAVAMSESKALVVYDKANGHANMATVLTISGTSISAGNNAIELSSRTIYASTVALSEGKALVCFSDQKNSGYGTAAILTISGTTVSVGTEKVFNHTNTIHISACPLNGIASLVAFNSNSIACVADVITFA